MTNIVHKTTTNNKAVLSQRLAIVDDDNINTGSLKVLTGSDSMTYPNMNSLQLLLQMLVLTDEIETVTQTPSLKVLNRISHIKALINISTSKPPADFKTMIRSDDNDLGETVKMHISIDDMD
jgi:hypothetical protein